MHKFVTYYIPVFNNDINYNCNKIFYSCKKKEGSCSLKTMCYSSLTLKC